MPDSTTNEVESHGFIKFKVNQIPNLAEGIVLENNAGIYFDFNDPIITNTTQHTINYFTPNFVTTNISEEACETYMSPSGTHTWTNSGTYYDVMETENGDSVIVVDLVIGTAFSAMIIEEEDTISANVPNAEYQWLDCNNNYEPIPGETNQEFTVINTKGDYAVQITLDGCQSISECYYLDTTTGVEDNAFASSIKVHPNPADNFIYVDLGQKHQEISFTLRNALGQIILRENTNTANAIRLEINEPAGVYLLQVETKEGKSATFKILKK